MFSQVTQPLLRLASQPALALSAGATAVVAPAFLKSEDRGYFKTSLIATPMIAALAVSGPSAFSALKKSATEHISFFRSGALSMNYRDLRNFMESGRIDLSSVGPSYANLLDQMAIDYFSAASSNRPVTDLFSEAHSLYQQMMALPEKKELVQNAVQSAYLNTASPTELAGGVIPSLDEILNRGRGNPEFVSRLLSGLKRAKVLNDAGPYVMPIGLASPKTLTSMALDQAGLTALERTRPEVAQILRNAKKRGLLAHTQIVAEQTTDGSIGRLLGLNLKTDSMDFQIPLFDPSTGMVHGGQNFSQVGVGRRIYGSDVQGTDVDVWLTENLFNRDLNGNDLSALREDLKRAAYFGGVDPLNEFKIASHIESAQAVLPQHALLLRSRSMVPTSMAVFGGKTFDQLGTSEKIELTRRALRQGYTRIGSEGGIGKGTFEFGSSSLFQAGGLPSFARQDPFYRAFSKELQLSGVSDFLRPRVGTSATGSLGVDAVPEIMAHLTGISAQQKSFFGDLPASTAELGKLANARRAISALQKTGLSKTAAAHEYAQMVRGYLSDPEYLAAARRLGGLGEGGAMLHPRFSNLAMEARATMRVNDLRVAPGQTFGPRDVIGYLDGQPITSPAPHSVVESVASVGNQFELTVKQRYLVGRGAKHDMFGIKGLSHMAESSEEFDRMVALLNAFPGRAKAPSFVDAIAPLHYTQAKLEKGAPFRALLEQAAEVSARVSGAETGLGQALHQAGYSSQALQEVNAYMNYLAGKGIRQIGNRWLEDSDLVSGLNETARARRIRKITARTEKFFGRMSQLAPGLPDELFQSFAGSGSTDLLSYMQRYSMSTAVSFWDTTLRNVPSSTSITWDLFGEMYRLGHDVGIGDIMGRAEFLHGDPKLAAQFAHKVAGMSFSRPFGKSVSVFESAPAGIGVSSLEARAGSIFDPTRVDLQQNFSLDLGEVYRVTLGGRDVNVRHLPVLGKSAFRGETNQYGVGKYAATDYEKSLQGVLGAVGDPERMAGALKNYFETSQHTLFGKKGFFRAKAFDPLGVSGFVQTAASPTDPFMMTISESTAERIKDLKLRQALLDGETAYAVAARHPIQAAPYVRVRVQKDLGPNIVGMDERIRAWFGADDDKDLINLFFFRSGSQAEREALASINNLDSQQHRSLRTIEQLYGSLEDSRNVVDGSMKGMGEQVRASVLTGAAREEQLFRRQAGSTIGAYSNLRDRLMINLDMHPTLGHNPEARALLGHLFWPIRQVPIAAQKSNVSVGTRDPMAVYQRLSTALSDRSEKGAQQFYEAMQQVAQDFGKGNYAEVVASDRARNLFREFVTGSQPEADAMARLITQSAENLGTTPMSLYARIGDSVPFLQGMAGESRSSSNISRVLGILNRQIRSSAQEVKGAFQTSKPILALGLGAAAVAGLMTTTVTRDMEPAVPSFGRPSANRYRPEEAVGVSDHVPGEPVPGSMSSDPPRRQLAAPAQTRTTLVAPMQQAVNIDVRAKVPDRSAAAELQRMIRQAAGEGNSSVTVNHVGGFRRHSSRLRTRERIREELDRLP